MQLLFSRLSDSLGGTDWLSVLMIHNVLYAASNGGVHTFDATSSFNNDVSWVISTGFA